MIVKPYSINIGKVNDDICLLLLNLNVQRGISTEIAPKLFVVFFLCFKILVLGPICWFLIDDLLDLLRRAHAY